MNEYHQLMEDWTALFRSRERETPYMHTEVCEQRRLVMRSTQRYFFVCDYRMHSYKVSQFSVAHFSKRKLKNLKRIFGDNNTKKQRLAQEEKETDRSFKPIFTQYMGESCWNNALCLLHANYWSARTSNTHSRCYYLSKCFWKRTV